MKKYEVVLRITTKGPLSLVVLRKLVKKLEGDANITKITVPYKEEIR